MTALLAANFQLADWIVLALYLALLVVTGVWFSRREQKTTNEYFLAGRSMPMWAVSVSIIATSLSAATFVGAPEQSYKGDLTYLSTNIGGLIAVVIVAYVFIPAFYRNNCTTVYELLERRFGPSSKYTTSAAFMVGRLFASGARIYIGAIPLSMILFGSDVASSPNYIWCMIASIAALTIVGTLYTLTGGIASVIWTDVIQTVVLVVAVLAAMLVLLNKIDVPLWKVVELLREVPYFRGENLGPWGKLTIVRTGFDASKPIWAFDPGAQFTLLTAVFGFSLLNLAAYGTDHDMVQRMLTCKSAVQGSRSVLFSMLIGIPIVLAFLVVGLLLFVYYRYLSPFVLGTSSIAQGPPGQVFVGFILTEMPSGLRALMLAGLFAAGVGSLTSAINAMAATTIKDFYQRFVPGRGERHYLKASRWMVLVWGAALGGFAIVCLFWQQASPGTTLIGLALGVMTFAYAGLLAVFITALFTKRGNSRSVIAALIAGFVSIALMQDWAWSVWTPLLPFGGASLSKTRLAFPWHMTIGTLIALFVCVLGRPTHRDLDAQSDPRCLQCGYSKRGLPSATCPECGSALSSGDDPDSASRAHTMSQTTSTPADSASSPSPTTRSLPASGSND